MSRQSSLEGEENRVNGVGGEWSMGSVLKAAELSWGRVFTGVGVLDLGGGDVCTFCLVSDKVLAIFGCFSCLLSFS